jgi:hypothetical protein
MTDTTPRTELTEAEMVAEIARFGFDRPEIDTAGVRLATLMLLGHLASQDRSAAASAVLRSSADWAAIRDIYVLDASGWDRSTPAAFDVSWGKPITETEFDARAARSHTRARPDTDLSHHATGWRITKRVPR